VVHKVAVTPEKSSFAFFDRALFVTYIPLDQSASALTCFFPGRFSTLVIAGDESTFYHLPFVERPVE